jgi:hypothetical protein
VVAAVDVCRLLLFSNSLSHHTLPILNNAILDGYD